MVGICIVLRILTLLLLLSNFITRLFLPNVLLLLGDQADEGVVHYSVVPELLGKVRAGERALRFLVLCIAFLLLFSFKSRTRINICSKWRLIRF